jgi:hypothetical protein
MKQPPTSKLDRRIPGDPTRACAASERAPQGALEGCPAFTQIGLIEDGEFWLEAYQLPRGLGSEISVNATNCDNPVF